MTIKRVLQQHLIWLFVLIGCCVLPLMAEARVGSVANPKYAALVIDSDTGNVLFARYANDRRHPASLTKMMTLYLTFEALHKGKIKMDTMLPVSQHAASMPQTNLFLRKGDSISVRDAIRALVIRSANDVAAVLAEYLGGSESGFGVKMTQKARQLGMNSTNFRNASGLPDVRQYTSARDLAVLAMALKKHFPQYYSFFSLRDFYFRGRNYHTHNRIIERLPGAEGMKTGYINMSGFNLVTTVSRSGRNLVGVVLGGRTAATRDNHMIQIIEQAYLDLKNTNSNQNYAAVSPVAPSSVVSSGPKVVRGPFGGTVHGRVVRPPAPISKPSIQLASTQSYWTAPVKTQPSAPAMRAAPAVASAPAAPVIQQNAAPAVPAVPKIWGIQVGAYSRQSEAQQAAVNAAQVAQSELIGAKMMITDSSAQTGAPLHRARLANLDESQARKACEKLISHQQSCFVIKVE